MLQFMFKAKINRANTTTFTVKPVVMHFIGICIMCHEIGYTLRVIQPSKHNQLNICNGLHPSFANCKIMMPVKKSFLNAQKKWNAHHAITHLRRMHVVLIIQSLNTAASSTVEGGQLNHRADHSIDSSASELFPCSTINNIRHITSFSQSTSSSAPAVHLWERRAKNAAMKSTAVIH